jgi:hypothetical protein
MLNFDWSIVALLVFAVVLIVGIMVVSRFRAEMGKGLSLITGGLDIVTTLVQRFDKDPTQDSPFEKVLHWVHTGVYAAEQLYKASQLPAAERKAYVVEYVHSLANAHNITWTQALSQHVETVIESVVSRLPTGQKISMDDIRKIVLERPDIILEILMASGIQLPEEDPAVPPATTDEPASAEG